MESGPRTRPAEHPRHFDQLDWDLGGLHRGRYRGDGGKIFGAEGDAGVRGVCFPGSCAVEGGVGCLASFSFQCAVAVGRAESTTTESA